MTSRHTKTASEALAQVETTLHQLTAPTGLAIVPDVADPSKPTVLSTPRDQDIHKLSTVSLSQTRTTLTIALDVLKNSVLARETWTEAMAERLVRVKADTAARAQVAKASKSSLAICRQIALTSDPFATRSVRAVHRLHAIADHSGATTFRDDGLDDSGRPTCEINVSGSKFIADFSFANLSNESTQVDVNFRFLTDANDERADPAVGHSFASLIRQEKFDDLRKSFEALVAIETLSAAVPNVSLCDALRAFEDDLFSAQNVERKSVVNDSDRIRVGHGLIERTALGLRITFMPEYWAILGVEKSVMKRQISMSRSRLILKQGSPPHSTVPPLPMFDFGECEMTTVLAQYVLRLHRPVLVSLSVAKALERIAGSDEALKAALRAASLRGTPVRELSSGRDSRIDHGDKRGYWPSLQKLLAPRMFGLDGNGEGEGEGDRDGTEVTNLVKERSHWSQTGTEFIAAAALLGGEYVEFSHSGGDVIGAVALHRILICQPRHVAPVLAILRQQIVFNQLFQSCFASPVRVVEGMRPIVRQPVEVVICDSPSLLQFSFFDGVVDDLLSMIVQVAEGGNIRVSLKMGTGRRHVCSDRKATAALQLSRSIPLTIHTIVQVANRASSVPGPARTTGTAG